MEKILSAMLLREKSYRSGIYPAELGHTGAVDATARFAASPLYLSIDLYN
jgi:hypothetical protein